jgi:hypothetical protein
MVFIETRVFTRQIDGILDADDYRALQDALILRPEAGDLIPGAEGLRKIRWNAEGRGKRGGIRVIYYLMNTKEQLYLLFAYPKNKQENLTKEQLNQLVNLMRKEWT